MSQVFPTFKYMTQGEVTVLRTKEMPCSQVSPKISSRLPKTIVHQGGNRIKQRVGDLSSNVTCRLHCLGALFKRSEPWFSQL